MRHSLRSARRTLEIAVLELVARVLRPQKQPRKQPKKQRWIAAIAAVVRSYCVENVRGPCELGDVVAR